MANPQTSSTTAPPRPRTVRPPRNGVDTPALFATIDAVRQQPGLAKFRFRATNRWIKGTHSRGRMETFFGAGTEHRRPNAVDYDADHPAVLCGTDQGPTPVEFLLHALAACLTSGIANVAAARGVTLTEIESSVEGDIDLRGILGLEGEVRNGYQKVRASFRIRGDAPAEKLAALVEQSRSRSAVFDVLTSGVPVEIAVDAG